MTRKNLSNILIFIILLSVFSGLGLCLFYSLSIPVK